MDTKLTLSLNKEVIQNAQEYAKANNTSLSNLIESYLSVLVEKRTEKPAVTPLVKSLIGVIELKSEDPRKAYRDRIAEKYE
ncbi:MAG: DUF6364 family protein [Cyclobacteriaceae bacterium]